MSGVTLEEQLNKNSISTASDLYRAVWRWHFYAGLLVLPFLILLAVTGALYLFRDELNAIVHADLKRVDIQQNITRATPNAMLEAALAAYPGTAIKYTDPATPNGSAEITITNAANETQAVYVNPYDGKVLGMLPDRGTIEWTIRKLHSLKIVGAVGPYIIEIAGGWAILLVGTGVYLWWPRNQTGGVVTIRGAPRKRVFWRDLHAVSGIFLSLFILFLATTGMPWSVVWGAKVNEWANGNNFGYPAGVNVGVPISDEHLNHIAKTSWTLEQAKIPESTMPDMMGTALDLDQAVAVVDGLGLHRGYSVSLPSSPSGVYSASVYPSDLSQQRIVHIDQYSGKPLIDISYADYGPLGKSLEWGINVHIGDQFGTINRYVLLAVCTGIVMLAASAGVMWWKRRPSGSLGVPPMPVDRHVFRGLIIILAIGGIIFPLVGMSLAVMLILDWSYFRLRTARPQTQTR